MYPIPHPISLSVSFLCSLFLLALITSQRIDILLSNYPLPLSPIRMHAPQKQDFCLSVQCWILNSSWNLIGTQIIFKQMIRTTIISFSSLRNIFVKDGNTPQPHDGTFRTLKAVLSLGKNSFLAQCLHNSLEQTYFCCLTYIFLICKCLSGSTHSVGSMCSP